MQDRYARLSRFLGFVLVAVFFSGLPAAARADTNQRINITTLSSRPDIVSGGTALVGVNVPSGVPLTALTVLLNSQDVTGAFQPEASGNSLLGLVQGMPLGRNQLIAEVLDPRNQVVLSARLTLTNYPITGPIFSGPQEQPFYCMTHGCIPVWVRHRITRKGLSLCVRGPLYVVAVGSRHYDRT